MKRHNIKILEAYADAVLSGEKTFEIRENDRGYQTGDEVCFEVIDGSRIQVRSHDLNGKVYTITYLLHGWGLKENWCVFSIKPLCDEGACTVHHDFTHSTTAQEEEAQEDLSDVQLRVAPNTQCVDCPHGMIMDCPDDLSRMIRCRMYMTNEGEPIIREPGDTCICDTVDIAEMLSAKNHPETF